MIYAILLMISALKGPLETCDPALNALFAPPPTELGGYEVCTTPEPLAALARPGWQVEAMAAPDALGSAGFYDRASLARLYGGRRPLVARGWIREDGRFESVTLVSPHPNRTLTRLLPGTLIVRFFVSSKEGR